MRRVLAAALVAMAGLSCDSGLKAGEIVFELTSPNQADGALQFVVRSGDMESLVSVNAACGGCQVFTERVSDTDLRGVVVGSFGAGPLLRVMVSDVGAQTYGASVIAVAAPNYTLRNSAGYVLQPAN